MNSKALIAATFTALMTLTITVAVSACPDLNGVYSCNAISGQFARQISIQKVSQGGSTVYSAGGLRILTNGSWNPAPGLASFVPVLAHAGALEYAANCSGSRLNINLRGQRGNGNLTIDSSNGVTVNVTVNGTIGSQSRTYSAVCTRR